MSNDTYSFAMPPDLSAEVRRTAKETGLSVTDVIRQSMKLGLPKLRERLSTSQVKPMSPEEARRAFARSSEWDALESAMAKRPLFPSQD